MKTKKTITIEDSEGLYAAMQHLVYDKPMSLELIAAISKLLVAIEGKDQGLKTANMNVKLLKKNIDKGEFWENNGKSILMVAK